jgi:hypothetical protein
LATVVRAGRAFAEDVRTGEAEDAPVDGALEAPEIAGAAEFVGAAAEAAGAIEAGFCFAGTLPFAASFVC